jgi:hypothetical protein
MQRFMMPDIHSQYSTNAASDNRKHKQSGLRYAPTALLRLPLVNAIDNESKDVNAYEINHLVTFVTKVRQNDVKRVSLKKDLRIIRI